MPSNQSTPTRRLTANDVYELTSTVLQEYFDLDMSNSIYEASDIWDVLVTAAVQQTTVETACGLLERAPSPNTVRAAVKALLMNDEQLMHLERTVNEMLVARLPKNLLRYARPCAVDFTDLPYHGQHAPDDDHIRRGRARTGTIRWRSACTGVRTQPWMHSNACWIRHALPDCASVAYCWTANLTTTRWLAICLSNRFRPSCH